MYALDCAFGMRFGHQKPDLTPISADAENFAQICLEWLPNNAHHVPAYQRYQSPFGPSVECVQVVRFKPEELTPQIQQGLVHGKEHKLQSLADFSNRGRGFGYGVSQKLIGSGFDFDLRLQYVSGTSPYNCTMWLVLPSSEPDRSVLVARLLILRMVNRITSPSGKYRKYPFGGLNCIEVVRFRRDELTEQTISRLEWARRENLNEVKSLADFAEGKRDLAYFVSRELIAKGVEPRDLRITLDRPAWEDEIFCKLWLALPKV